MPNTMDAYYERVARLKADPTIRLHGNLGTYNNWGCRCPDCTAERLRYDRARAKLAAEDAFDVVVDDAEHGLAGYRTGCKCDICMTAGKAFAQQFSTKSALDDVI